MHAQHTAVQLGREQSAEAGLRCVAPPLLICCWAATALCPSTCAHGMMVVTEQPRAACVPSAPLNRTRSSSKHTCASFLQ
jgi:hypothetical protein